MNFLSKLAVAVAATAMIAVPAFASVTQTVSYNSSYNVYWGSNDEIGRITFASGTNFINSLTATATTKDQGWGGSCACNGIIAMLYDTNNNAVWGEYIIGSGHDWGTYNFDQSSNLDAFTALNKAMAAIDYSKGGTASMVMSASDIGWGGWELHVNGASMTIESSKVPEPTSLALMGLGLAGFAAVRRKAVKR
jgi:hypothetical protein